MRVKYLVAEAYGDVVARFDSRDAAASFIADADALRVEWSAWANSPAVNEINFVSALFDSNYADLLPLTGNLQIVERYYN